LPLSKSKPNASSKAVALLVAGSSSFLTPFMSSFISIALPAIGAEFENE
jgi:hypothetical protein